MLFRQVIHALDDTDIGSTCTPAEVVLDKAPMNRGKAVKDSIPEFD